MRASGWSASTSWADRPRCLRWCCSGEQVRYVPGTAVNKAREAYAGGEHKSDPKDAFVNKPTS
jgi:hypothetical protein